MDHVTFNENRIYGPVRLQRLLAHLVVAEYADFGDGHRMFVAIRAPARNQSARSIWFMLEKKR